ncbi:hypothetical protein V1477_019667 [Vespula maculifrons]|uniref:Uncharacterized protein n=1 Tax=Vespula maculifrons TaxID=7453 RepID=A0ABD2AR48_VESMC
MPLSTLNMRNILNGVVKVGMWMKMRQEGIDYKAESSSRALPLVGPSLPNIVVVIHYIVVIRSNRQTRYG